MRKRPTKIVPSSTITMLLDSLQEIEWHFENEGFDFESESDPSTVGADHTSDEEEDDEGEEFGPKVFDAEEIEVAIDSFISQLSDKRLIKKPVPGKAPSFGQVFEKLFGSTSRVVDLAREFEEQVKGYAGWVSHDDMQNAYDTFMALKKAIEELRDAAKP
ncbi:MAG: hypothetical protein ACJ74Z_10515 [Bryobacteraceae bacterium]|jgi:hypothetical protein